MSDFLTNLNTGWRQIEYRLLGPLPPDARRNMRLEFVAAMLAGPFVGSLAFFPVVFRRLGASPDWIAFYLAQAFIGFMLTSFSVMVMPRRRGLLRFGLFFWISARAALMVGAFLSGAESLILLTLFFWCAESFPIPVYTRIMQAAYPARSRGRVIALVRVGMALVSLLFTPLAGWILDTWGHTVLFPIAGLSGMVSMFVFARLKYDEAALPESRAGAGGGLWKIAIQDRRFTLYLLTLIVFGVGHLSGFALHPLVQVDRLRLSYGDFALLNLVQSAFFLIGYVIWGRQIDRRGGVWTVRLIFSIALVIPLTYLFADSGWMLAPAFAAMGLVNSGMDVGMLNTVMQLADGERLGEYSALQTTVLGLRGLAAPFIGVALATGLGLGYNAVFALGLGLIVMAVALLLRVKTDKMTG